MTGHTCRYRERVVWSGWSRSGPLTERLARQIPLCEVCGGERPARQPRPPTLREVRAEVPEASPIADATGRKIAKALLDLGKGREGLLPTRGFLTDLARRGIPASLVEEWIEAFLRAGWLTVVWRPGSPARLTAVTLRRPSALREFARPGEDDRRRSALHEARARVAPLVHPKAVEISALLADPEAERFAPPLIEALAALALHAESGEVLAERVFSTRHLGGSKALASLRGSLERLAGPLEELGIREGASLTLLGGDGILRREGAQELDLLAFAPFVGLAREAVESLEEIAFPDGGLFVVENLAVFEACCRGEVEAARDSLVAWSAGYPGRSIRRLVEMAGAAGAPLRIWADLDLDGVRIARLTASWSPSGAEFFRMSPRDLESAAHRNPLTPQSLAVIRRDLEERPEAPLAGTLRALLEAGFWVEQEAFLAHTAGFDHGRSAAIPT
ncbi:MAG TPA: DUF2399 domain-containing protein [Thermoanaerobaculia bacterium]|nr:DUF2399 domain-containing protein [Thermoanaerobaculia bacterium]